MTLNLSLLDTYSMSATRAAPALPFDILAHVLYYARTSTPSMVALCLVSRDAYALAFRRLYHTVEFSLGQWKPLPLFFDSIQSNAELGRYVVSLSIHSPLVTPSACSPFVAALRNMSNLRHLFCITLDYVIRCDITILDVLRGLTRLESIQFDVSGSTSHIVHVANLLSAMKSVVLHKSRHFITFPLDPGYRVEALDKLLLRSADRLTSLALTGVTPYGVEEFLHANPTTMWPHLAELAVHTLTLHHHTRAFPNLRRLRILNGSDETVRALLEPSSFPQLDQLDICTAGMVPDDFRTRAVAHLYITLKATRMTRGFLPFMTLFSWADMRSLQLSWTGQNTPDIVLRPLRDILRHCTSLRYLGISVARIGGYINTDKHVHDYVRPSDCVPVLLAG